MSSHLHGKTILITGATSGIGRSTALEFAHTYPSSLNLILTARRLSILMEVAAEIKKDVGDGVSVHVAELDMCDSEAISRFVESLNGVFGGRVDVLVNNAGVALGGMSPVGELKEKDVETTFATNFHGLVKLTQGILRMFNARSPPTGTIININSIAGREAYPGGSIYCASKGAVSSFSSALRKELVGTRIRVLEIAPGQVETEFSVTRFGGDRVRAGEVYRGVEPLTPGDVAEVVVWMVGRRENVVVADVLMFPNHQASATVLHRRG